MILLDVSAAFNTINLSILLEQLVEMGVGGTALEWLESHLQKILLG